MHAGQSQVNSGAPCVASPPSFCTQSIPMKTAVSRLSPPLAKIMHAARVAALVALACAAAASPVCAASTNAAYDGAVQALYRTSLPDATGAQQSLAQYRGKPVVVNFWASWCAPCVKEMPALSELQRQYAKKGIAFVGIGVD